MKIAIFHNYIDNIGGAEIVSLTLGRHFNADIYTTNIDSEKIIKMGFQDVLPRIKSIGKIPKNAPYKQQFALWKFRRLNLNSKYNAFIISGDWAMSGAVNNHPNIWYAHSPLNELWQFKDYIKQEVLSWWKKPFFELWVQMNRILTLRYSKYVDVFVCNSKNTQSRLGRFYKKEATVLYPPINTSMYSNKTNGDYWLSVNRLFKNKKIELQMETFSHLPDEKLIVVGSYEKGSKLFEEHKLSIEKIKPKNVEIKHWIKNNELIELYSNCKGFITTARDEDFGMTVVEALASGKPVIAPNEGGYKESMIGGQTGILIDNITPEKIIVAIATISKELELKPHKYSNACENNSKNFDIKVFTLEMEKILSHLF